jgi:hypothetical protein
VATAGSKPLPAGPAFPEHFLLDAVKKEGISLANITRYSSYSPIDELFNEFTRGWKEDIHVDVEGNHISLRAEVKQSKEEKKDEKVIYSECSYGALSRGFDLPTEVDEQGAKAEYKDGVLNLTLPKKAGSAARCINVS